MTLCILIHSAKAKRLLAHPSRAKLREQITNHEGPWTADDIESLNQAGYGRLVFRSENGQLHVYSN